MFIFKVTCGKRPCLRTKRATREEKAHAVFEGSLEITRDDFTFLQRTRQDFFFFFTRVT